MLSRRTLVFLVIALTALIQARLLPEIELDTVLNLPLVLLLPLSSVRRRATLVAGALIAGLLLDALLWRPLGQTALALCVGVLVAAAARGGGDAGWVRRSLAALAGYGTAAATVLVSSGLLGIDTTGFESAQLERHGVNAILLVLGSVIGTRRRARQLRERPLDDRLG